MSDLTDLLKGIPAHRELAKKATIVFDDSDRFVVKAKHDLEKAGGPFIGKRGGKWADAQHTIPWKEGGQKDRRAKVKQVSLDKKDAGHIRKLATALGKKHGIRLSTRTGKGSMRGSVSIQTYPNPPTPALRIELIEALQSLTLPSGKKLVGNHHNHGSGHTLEDFKEQAKKHKHTGIQIDVVGTPAAQKSMDADHDLEKAGGPFIGKRGGKWADAKHTIPWKEGKKASQQRKHAHGGTSGGWHNDHKNTTADQHQQLQNKHNDLATRANHKKAQQKKDSNAEFAHKYERDYHLAMADAHGSAKVGLAYGETQGKLDRHDKSRVDDALRTAREAKYWHEGAVENVKRDSADKAMDSDHDLQKAIVAYDEAIEKATLTTEGRKRIKESNFALAGKRYPIQDATHARNALARVAQHGTPEEIRQVRRAVKRKYPSIDVGGDE